MLTATAVSMQRLRAKESLGQEVSYCQQSEHLSLEESTFISLSVNKSVLIFVFHRDQASGSLRVSYFTLLKKIPLSVSHLDKRLDKRLEIKNGVSFDYIAL